LPATPKRRRILVETLKKHLDTGVVLIGIAASLLSSMIWLNGKFNDIDCRLVRIETVLVLQGIMPKDLASVTKNTPIAPN
jgi:hypothetical protein